MASVGAEDARDAPYDVSALSEAKRRDLHHFKDISGIADDDCAARILEESDWNLEHAVHKFMGLGESGNLAGAARRRSQNRPENPAPIDLAPPNLLVFRRDRPIGGWFQTFLNILLSPIYFTYNVFSSIISTFTSFLWPDPRTLVTDPLGDVRNFIDTFKQTYAPVSEDSISTDTIERNTTPPFFEGTYAQALQEAKRSLRFLIVYLHCGSHEDTEEFCRQTLQHPITLAFLNDTQQCIFWACDINSPEGYRTSQIFREHSYPFVGVIGLSVNRAHSSSSYGPPSRMALLGRIEGLVSATDFVEQLSNIINNNQTALLAARAEREERDFTNRLRREQDEAYAASLAADRAKDAERTAALEAEAARAREAADAEARRQQLEVARRRRQQRWHRSLPQQPPQGTPGTVKLSTKLPNGNRAERIFSTQDSVKHLYYFIISQEGAPKNFDIEANFPKRILDCRPADESDIEDYLSTDVSGDANVSKSDDWTPKTGDPPSFEALNLTNPELLFVLDRDA
uniref:FAS-associated factor 2 n=1 Tax=Schistocephalus solidus TaxID=70667 RepID=A0A0V0J1U0_SCHSO